MYHFIGVIDFNWNSSRDFKHAGKFVDFEFKQKHQIAGKLFFIFMYTHFSGQITTTLSELKVWWCQQFDGGSF